jgi:hypothetical protein
MNIHNCIEWTNVFTYIASFVMISQFLILLLMSLSGLTPLGF